MERQDISTDFFQMDFELDTGKVTMTPGEGDDIHYDIVKPVAWDNIQWDDQFAPLLRQCSYFIFGSLSARSETNRDLLFRLQDIAKYRVLDINLRPPHYNRSILGRLLGGTELLKLNLGELELAECGGGEEAGHEDRDGYPHLAVLVGGNADAGQQQTAQQHVSR